MDDKKCKHEFKVKGDELLKKLKEIIHSGNVRRIIIKNSEGKVFLEIPVTVGILGVLVAPAWSAVGALVAMASSYTIEVINREAKSDIVKSEKEESEK